MTIVAFTGDGATTTTLAVAATWPHADDVVVVELDESGGSATAWLDTPSTPTLGTIVANPATDDATVLETLRSMSHRSRTGLEFVAAPIRSRAARRAVAEASTSLVPALAADADLVALCDLGRRHATDLPTAVLGRAAVTVVVHRQERASPAAASVRIERLVEVVEQLAGFPVVLAIVGDDPFDPREIVQLVDEAAPGTVVAWASLADDPLAAAVLAGRRGVSAPRLRRLPLVRSAAGLATELRRRIGSGAAVATSAAIGHVGATTTGDDTRVGT